MEYIYIFTHTHNGILFSLIKEGNLATCSNMDELGVHYAKLNNPERERKYCMVLLICMES